MIVSSESCLAAAQCSSTAETGYGGGESFESEPTIRLFIQQLQQTHNEAPSEPWSTQTDRWLSPHLGIREDESQQQPASSILGGKSSQFPKFTCSHGRVPARIIPLRLLRRELELGEPPMAHNGSILWLCWGEEKSRLRALCESVIGRALNGNSILRRSGVDWTLAWRHSNGRVEMRPVWVVQKRSEDQLPSVACRSTPCSVGGDAASSPIVRSQPSIFRQCYGRSGMVTLKYKTFDIDSKTHVVLVEPDADGKVLRVPSSFISQAARILVS